MWSHLHIGYKQKTKQNNATVIEEEIGFLGVRRWKLEEGGQNV